ncbi:ABC transporter permease [Roseivirga sp. BDSF3-8]|uniref:ABC transporter permease n=1 Tax=Roseivirga sp. BDSF3-8 TaxID=3241598 RepID=UPI003531939A
MLNLDNLQEIWFTIRKNKLRTALTAFGVFWGIFMLIFLLGSGTGLQKGVEKDFADEAINSIYMWTGTTSKPWKGMSPGRRIIFDRDDAELIKENVPGVGLVAPRSTLGGDFTLQYGANFGSFTVMATTDDYNRIYQQQHYLGRPLNELDLMEKRKVVAIGKRVADILFPETEDPTGEYIRIKDSFFRVIGVFTDNSNNGRNQERVYIPITTFQQVFDNRNRITMFAITTDGTVSAKEMEQGIIETLSKKYRFDPADRQALGINNTEENYKQFTNVFFAIRTLVWVVGIGTLMAGIIGVSNIMIIIVKERTREIGIRKAIGARPFSIVSMIVQESVLITAVAGYFGLVAGVGILELMSFGLEQMGGELPFFRAPSIDFNVAMIATIILVVAGAVSGLLPAMKAAKIKPIEALRSE